MRKFKPTWEQSKKRSKLKTLKHYTTYLILSLVASACAGTPKSHPKLDLDFEVIELRPGQVVGCVPMKDWQEIREMQLRCEAPK